MPVKTDQGEAEQDAENVLMALAGPPLPWTFARRFSALHEDRWNAEANGVAYCIYTPALPLEIALDAALGRWHVWITRRYLPRKHHLSCEAVAPTFEAAQALCNRHALSGDWSELKARQKALDAERQWYQEQAKASMVALWEVYLAQPFPLPRWRPAKFDRALAFQAKTRQGSYAARYVPGQWWTVQFQPNPRTGDEQVVEKTFLNRGILDMACGFHSATEQWIGVLDEYHPPAACKKKRRA